MTFQGLPQPWESKIEGKLKGRSPETTKAQGHNQVWELFALLFAHVKVLKPPAAVPFNKHPSAQLQSNIYRSEFQRENLGILAEGLQAAAMQSMQLKLHKLLPNICCESVHNIQRALVQLIHFPMEKKKRILPTRRTAASKGHGAKPGKLCRVFLPYKQRFPQHSSS